MGNLIDKFIDNTFDRIRKSQEKAAQEALDADPDYQKAKAKLEAATTEAEDYMDELDKKYPHLHDRWRNNEEQDQNEIKKNQKHTSNNKISCSFWIVIIIGIGIYLIYF